MTESNGGERPESTRPNRRKFLQGAGLVAAGVAATGAVDAATGLFGFPDNGQPYIPVEYSVPKPRKTPGFDHLIVVMGENRSFDNLLGYLYTPDAPPRTGKFEGLDFGAYANTASDGTKVPAHAYSGSTDYIMGRPEPDPGEEYPHVNTQLFGQLDEGNVGLDIDEVLAPFNLPDDDTTPAMSGFVRDYESNFYNIKGREPTAKEHDQIMGSFTPQILPVVSTLAREFGVYDHWFCTVPSQTFCNRSFFHASTSHGFVTNRQDGGYAKWLNAASAPTVFNRLEEAGLTWRIYFDELQLISLTGMLHEPALKQFWQTARFATMKQFYDDVATGHLPEYAFVEPRMIYNHNDFHPPYGSPAEGDITTGEVFNSAFSDVRAGEALIHEIYSAVRTSTSKSGSNYLNTALLITFDEHGGTYDHVPPPAGNPPLAIGPGEMGFRFDRLGCRVPAIIVSAHTARGSVFAHEMHHGSLSATLSERFGLEPLTARDAGAPTLQSAFNLKVPRHIADWPQTLPAFVPPNPDVVDHSGKVDRDRELSPPAKGIIGMLIERYGTEAERQNPPKTFGDAYSALTKYGRGLFGVQA